MRRRDIIKGVVSSAVAWPLVARAQQGEHMRRIAVLASLANDIDTQARLNGFRQGLQLLGWSEGHNLHIGYRSPYWLHFREAMRALATAQVSESGLGGEGPAPGGAAQVPPAPG